MFNDVCRLKHIATSKYLAVSPSDRRELVLRDTPDSKDSHFVLRKELFRPATERKAASSIAGDVSSVTPENHVIIET